MFYNVGTDLPVDLRDWTGCRWLVMTYIYQTKPMLFSLPKQFIMLNFMSLPFSTDLLEY